MDVSVLCLDELLRFLDSKQDECIVSCLELTRTAEANLNVLKVFSEAFNFREEVKKPTLPLEKRKFLRRTLYLMPSAARR
jgi:hypothetical protein